MNKTYFTPPPRLLLAIAAQNLGWRIALCELGDNAIDKRARRIDVFEGPTENRRPTWFEIRDDGDGCPDPVVIMTFGSRGEIPDELGLGRFGVGGSEAIMDIGGVDAMVEIDSVFDGTLRHVKLSWRQLLRSGDWGLDRVSWDGGPSETRGTRIRITPVRRAAIPKTVHQQLGYTFAPYLKDGGQIIFHKGGVATPLERWELPPLEDVIQTRVSVDGKSALVHVGIVPEGVRNERAGITIAHRHRVIEEASGSCCGDYGYQRICGVVMLDRNWELTKNKDGLNDGAADLYAAVYAASEPTLAKARQQYMLVENERWTEVLETEANRRLFAFARSNQNDAKARRHPGPTHGTVKPTGTGGRHRQAAEEQPGSTFPSRRSSKTVTRKTIGVKIQLGDFPEEDLRPGHFDPSGYVMLNQSHPCVAEDWDKRNIEGLIRVVAAIIANDEVWSRGSQGLFPFVDEGTPQERFLRLYGQFLGNMRLGEEQQ